MKQLAPGVWTHVIDAEGFPTLSAVVFTPRLRDRRRHAHRARRGRPGGRVPGQRGRRPPRRGREHASPLGPRVRQRRLRRRGHRRPARLPAPHPGGAAERRRVPSPAAGGGRAPAQRDLRGPAHLRRRGRVGAPHPHARPQRGLAGGLPHRAPAAAGRRHGRVAAAELRPARRGARSGSGRCASSSSCRSTSSCPRTGRRWTSRSSTPTSATSAASTRRSRPPRPPAPAAASWTCRPSGFLADGVAVDEVYATAHRENLLWAWDEV